MPYSQEKVNRSFGGTYCDGLAEIIARQRLRKHVPTHAPSNHTVEMFYLCQRMDRCYKIRAW
jgi:hypothetical protein